MSIIDDVRKNNQTTFYAAVGVLDLAVEDIAEAEPAVLALGGRVADEQPSDNGGFKVYLDPAGHPFCLCRQG